ncbi:hypothetical protein DVH24_022012 [Malus domestica]|uniref:Uncharacterized protein n=1 Tax=Malus domestica TaxID=3750 RepID=A0A498ITX5_MALDO|nr:hypothetical protein DVH24_022012 [Malus domestica]
MSSFRSTPSPVPCTKPGVKSFLENDGELCPYHVMEAAMSGQHHETSATGCSGLRLVAQLRDHHYHHHLFDPRALLLH